MKKTKAGEEKGTQLVSRRRNELRPLFLSDAPLLAAGIFRENRGGVFRGSEMYLM